MQLTLTVAGAQGARQDLLVDVDDDATAADLARALARATGWLEEPDGLFVRGQRLPDDEPVGSGALVDGRVVALRAGDPTGEPGRAPTAGWQLQVVGGPDAGHVVELPVGRHELGRGPAWGLTDSSVSRRHAVLVVTLEGATLADLGSANGTSLEGVPVPAVTAAPPAGSAPEPGGKEQGGTQVGAAPVPVQPGQVFRLGDSLLTVVPAVRADAAVEPAGPGRRQFVRAPRILPARRETRVALPTPPTEREPRKFPLVMVLSPLLLGVVMAVALRRPYYLFFAVASPLMLVANTLGDRRSAAKEQRKAKADHAAALADAERRVAEGLAAETARRRSAAQDPAAALLSALLPTRRLWERRRTDQDYLDVRVGTADLPAELVVDVPRGTGEEPEAPTVVHVPALVPLRTSGVLGLAGPAPVLAGLVRWVVLQLAVAHAPRDLAVTVLTGRKREDWSWVRWLPHARSTDPDAPVAWVGNDAETVGARVAELVALVKARREATVGAGQVPPESFPAHVLVVDGFRELRTTPGLAQVLEEGPRVGVYAVCADEEERFLPEACRATAVAAVEDPSVLKVSVAGAETLDGVLVEGVGSRLAEAAARALSPLKDVSADEEEATLPDSVRLLDVLGLEPPSSEAVRARWQLLGRTTRAVIGAGLDGPFGLDLRTDGPHGLVAGTTGAGKSELLQTLIASLAVGNRPDALNFVLVDYKGGSAFKDCVALPHTVGMVTDLDQHLVERALTSLSAELTLREHWLADAGVKDIDDYVDLQVREPHRAPLPRLLIVIDEFASMARELPDFVTGLVNIAQRGRSLGIHLVLATQRPSGVVSPEIRANTNLRISLRVTDAADSSDVLDKPDASRIPKSAPGRGFARLGHGALVPFQSGRIGGRRPGVRPVVAPQPFVAPLGWHQLGYARPQRPAGAKPAAADAELTDLAVLVSAIREAAAQEGVPAQRSPWLQALPETVLLEQVAPSLPSDALSPSAAPGDGGALPALVLPVQVGTVRPIPYGLRDLPAVQRQEVATFDPVHDGHLLVVGAARSGRSQVLRALAASAARQCSTADLHVYALDCGNGALLGLQELPHCGAVVTRTQTERAVRLLGRLSQEMERRQQLLAEGGFADVAEQRRAVPAEQRLPHVLLLLDRWEGFTTTLGEVDGGRLTDVLLAVVREGASLGISAVISGDRSLATARPSTLTDNKLVLRLADKGDYNLLGLNAKKLPDIIGPGRAFLAEGALETQVALLAPDPSGQGQAAALAEIAKAAHVRDSLVPRAQRPFRVDVLPSRITFEQAWSLLEQPASAEPFALTGVGGDELTAVGWDLRRGTGPAFVVAGPGRSGRSTVLLAMTESLLRTGARVAVFAPRQSPLRDLAGRVGVLDVVTDAASPAEHWRALMEQAGPAPFVVVVDDGEVLRDCPAAEVFRDISKGMAGEHRFLVLGGAADGICTGLSGWQVEVKKSRQGLLLSPQGTSDGDLLGVRLPRSATGGAVQPGRGLLHLGDAQLWTVATPTAPVLSPAG